MNVSITEFKKMSTQTIKMYKIDVLMYNVKC